MFSCFVIYLEQLLDSSCNIKWRNKTFGSWRWVRLVGVAELTETRITAAVVWTAVVFWQSQSKRVSSVCVSMSSELCGGQMETTQVLYCILSFSLWSTVVPDGKGDSQSRLVRGAGQHQPVPRRPVERGGDLWPPALRCWHRQWFHFLLSEFPHEPRGQRHKGGLHVLVVHELIRCLYNCFGHSWWPSPYS